MNDPKRIIVVVLGLITLSVFAFGIKGHMDSVGYKKQVSYTTAVQAPSKDLFNYAVDSQQGRVLANGEFKTDPKNLAKFDEMTQGFTYVRRTQEHYTMHTREVCTGSGKDEECHTEVYYTWDDVDSQEKYAEKLTLYGRTYNPSVFNIHAFLHDTDACAITAKDTNKGLFHERHGCESGWGGSNYYIDNNDRYRYETVPVSFTATFLASTYGGTLKGYNENHITLQNKSIGQVLKDVGKYQLIGFWVLAILLIFLISGAIWAAYAWVMADGEWSIYE
jgi:hypothetical protein